MSDPRAYDGQQYMLRITDTTTGETRESPSRTDWWDGASFWWAEGNGGCDCNRGNEFHRTLGGKRACGGGRYKLECVALDGTVLYSDDEYFV